MPTELTPEETHIVDRVVLLNKLTKLRQLDCTESQWSQEGRDQSAAFDEAAKRLSSSLSAYVAHGLHDKDGSDRKLIKSCRDASERINSFLKEAIPDGEEYAKTRQAVLDAAKDYGIVTSVSSLNRYLSKLEENKTGVRDRLNDALKRSRHAGAVTDFTEETAQKIAEHFAALQGQVHNEATSAWGIFDDRTVGKVDPVSSWDAQVRARQIAEAEGKLTTLDAVRAAAPQGAERPAKHFEDLSPEVHKMIAKNLIVPGDAYQTLKNLDEYSLSARQQHEILTTGAFREFRKDLARLCNAADSIFKAPLPPDQAVHAWVKAPILGFISEEWRSDLVENALAPPPIDAERAGSACQAEAIGELGKRLHLLKPGERLRLVEAALDLSHPADKSIAFAGLTKGLEKLSPTERLPLTQAADGKILGFLSEEERSGRVEDAIKYGWIHKFEELGTELAALTHGQRVALFKEAVFEEDLAPPDDPKRARWEGLIVGRDELEPHEYAALLDDVPKMREIESFSKEQALMTKWTRDELSHFVKQVLPGETLDVKPAYIAFMAGRAKDIEFDLRADLAKESLDLKDSSQRQALAFYGVAPQRPYLEYRDNSDILKASLELNGDDAITAVSAVAKGIEAEFNLMSPDIDARGRRRLLPDREDRARRQSGLGL